MEEDVKIVLVGNETKAMIVGEDNYKENIYQKTQKMTEGKKQEK